MGISDKITQADARLVITVILGIVALALLILVFVCPLPDNNKELALLIAGNFMGAFLTSITFWFGSSKGSADKQQELNKRNQER